MIMAFNQTDVGGRVDQSIPQWKRELILRRRVFGRTLQAGNSSVKLTCPAVVALVRQPDSFISSNCNNVIQSVQNNGEAVPTPSSLNQNPVDFHTSTSSVSVSDTNMRLVGTCSDGSKLINGIDVNNKQSDVILSDTCKDYNLIMGEDKLVKMKSALSGPNYPAPNNQLNLKIKKNLIKEPINGKQSKDDDGNKSDSSEELQYGPGIVNKLKSKYLSMTLREHKRISRPSIINLRRATSLENMLDDENDLSRPINSSLGLHSINKTEQRMSKIRGSCIAKPVIIGSHKISRNFGNRSFETMKRAHSMDTLLKTDSNNLTEQSTFVTAKQISTNKNKQHPIVSIVNENIIIVESKHDCSSDGSDKSSISTFNLRNNDDPITDELPPHDVVKQTLRIFETSPKKSVKTPQHNSLLNNVSEFSNKSSHVQHNAINKPTVFPKPLFHLKDHQQRLSSPKHSRPGDNFDSVNTVLGKSQVNKGVGEHNTIDPINLPCNPSYRSDKVGANDSTTKVITPRSVSPIVTVLPNNEQISSPSSQSTLQLNNESIVKNAQLKFDDSENPKKNNYFEDNDSTDSKPVLESALENIRRGGVTLQFSFTNEKNKNPFSSKSYLPRCRSPPQALNASLTTKENIIETPPPTAKMTVIKQQIPQHTKQVGIIRPLMTRPHTSPALTEQEIEKNLINRVKSIEQPVSKVVVAIKSLPDGVVLGSVSPDIIANKNVSLPRVSANVKNNSQRLWDEKLWHQNQNTIVFNFRDRKEVPDYIENDGLILGRKRERARVS